VKSSAKEQEINIRCKQQLSLNKGSSLDLCQQYNHISLFSVAQYERLFDLN
jgi:hypothetical protein